MLPALTFDDGPAECTSALLEVLARHDARATFFVIGQRAARRRELVRRIAREGHEVGNHSWSHPDLRALAPAALRVELERTSDAIERATGERPSLFRPPYGFTNRAVRDAASALGMRSVLWDVSTDDWLRPGAGQIAAVLRAASPGAVVLMHDGRAGAGRGERSQTVAAVARLLAERKPRGGVAAVRATA
jgi:peptidoglycan/xylan/chitin deacetylase (PgdA/CDA1 family)